MLLSLQVRPGIITKDNEGRVKRIRRHPSYHITLIPR
jgi:hypothetical protein